jgi:AcrR family transcriptional regulator
MDSTKSKILAAAIEHFVNKGFSGTSISEIAKTASINQSLIYHHIGNKQDLWKAVKTYLIPEHLLSDYKISEEDSLEELLDKIIDRRVSLYSDKRILRLMQWQSLEASNDELAGGSALAPNFWIEAIYNLQKKGKISKKYPADFFANFILSAVNGLIFDTFNLFVKDGNKRNEYIVMLKKSLEILLKC